MAKLDIMNIYKQKLQKRDEEERKRMEQIEKDRLERIAIMHKRNEKFAQEIEEQIISTIDFCVDNDLPLNELKFFVYNWRLYNRFFNDPFHQDDLIWMSIFEDKYKIVYVELIKIIKNIIDCDISSGVDRICIYPRLKN